MPMHCFLTLEGKNQGKIEGSVAIKGHEGKIEILAVDHTIDIPSNALSGKPSGQRVHGPKVLTKEIDKSSPKLFQALTSGEQFKSVVLEYYRISPKGTEEKYYTVRLSNAILTKMRAWVPNINSPENKQMGHMEDIAFTYEKITWTFDPDGIEAEDSWLAPKT
ncbi:MAG: Hcp protein [Solimicrobium sp.]|jgi:type VI secretion system secreted protein Hcp|nr:Hcp protein [Solimicrobium sp.]